MKQPDAPEPTLVWADESSREGCWRILRYLYDVGESSITCATESEDLCKETVSAGAELARADEAVLVALAGPEETILCRIGESKLEDDERVRDVVGGWKAGTRPVNTVVYNPQEDIANEPPALLVAPLRAECEPVGYLALRKRGLFTAGERGIFSNVCACISSRVAGGTHLRRSKRG